MSHSLAVINQVRHWRGHSRLVDWRIAEFIVDRERRDSQRTVIRQASPSQKEDQDQLSRLTRRVWIAQFDVNDENKILANKLWNAADFTAQAKKLHFIAIAN